MDQLKLPKSTLWRWLKAEGMVETEPQRLTELKRLAQRKGAAVMKAQRLERTAQILSEARNQVGTISRRDLWLLGVALYWAEGSKQQPGNISAGVAFTNSDPLAVDIFLRWLQELCGIHLGDMRFAIYLHETANVHAARLFWITQLALPAGADVRVYLKRNRFRTNRRNIGAGYHGVMRVEVRRSTALNRRITGWIRGICDALGSGAMVARVTLDHQVPGSTPGSPADGVGWAAGCSFVQDRPRVVVPNRVRRFQEAMNVI